jgi:hypothetical protein
MLCSYELLTAFITTVFYDFFNDLGKTHFDAYISVDANVFCKGRLGLPFQKEQTKTANQAPERFIS